MSVKTLKKIVLVPSSPGDTSSKDNGQISALAITVKLGGRSMPFRKARHSSSVFCPGTVPVSF